MISYNEAKHLGIKTCVDLLGQDFVDKYKNNTCYAYSKDEDNVFCFLGLTTETYTPTGKLMLTHDESDAFPYRATCSVSMETGKVFDEKVIRPEAA